MANRDFARFPGLRWTDPGEGVERSGRANSSSYVLLK